MTLRGRVISLGSLVLVVSVSLYLMLAWSNARRALAAELAAAKLGALQTVSSEFKDLPRSNHPARDLRQLVATFDGNRHIQATLVDGSGRALFSSRAETPPTPAPKAFAALMVPSMDTARLLVPMGDGSSVRLDPDPASDLGALWSASLSEAAVFLTAAAIGLALVYYAIGRALAPLQALSGGLSAIGFGRYGERVTEGGVLELVELQRGFNSMAEHLQLVDERNRSLEAQLLTIQDEERAEIARDLHDEIGPHLFAVALDAEMIVRSLGEGKPAQVGEQVRSIQSAVSYMQREVRDLLTRLRPTPAAELGLAAALRDLIAFWSSRQPGVEFRLDYQLDEGSVPNRLRDVLYRVAQEAVANALRHSATTRITIGALHRGKEIELHVRNLGTARAGGAEKEGIGLTGMRERVAAASGRLSIERGASGWNVVVGFDLVRCEVAA